MLYFLLSYREAVYVSIAYLIYRKKVSNLLRQLNPSLDKTNGLI